MVVLCCTSFFTIVTVATSLWLQAKKPKAPKAEAAPAAEGEAKPAAEAPAAPPAEKKAKAAKPKVRDFSPCLTSMSTPSCHNIL